MTTRIELITREFFNEIVNNEEAKYNYRPDWLKNEKTGCNLEIDIYYEENKLAVEVNGVFHKLKKVQGRDRFKQKKCKERGITYLGIQGIHDLWRFKNQVDPTLSLSKDLYEMMKIYRPNKTAFQHTYGKAKKAEKYWGKVNINAVNANKEALGNLERMYSRGKVDKTYYEKKKIEYGGAIEKYSPSL